MPLAISGHALQFLTTLILISDGSPELLNREVFLLTLMRSGPSHRATPASASDLPRLRQAKGLGLSSRSSPHSKPIEIGFEIAISGRLRISQNIIFLSRSPGRLPTSLLLSRSPLKTTILRSTLSAKYRIALQGISISNPNSHVIHRPTNSLHSLLIRFQLPFMISCGTFCPFYAPKYFGPNSEER
jgi:hypothetical protein